MQTVEIVEVAPRDGIQNEPVILATDDKVALVEKAIAAGIRRIEVTSFVNPKRVPQMGDAAELVAALPERDDVTYIALVLNERGFERAVETDIDEINFVVVTTDTFNQKNQGATTMETVGTWTEIAGRASGVVSAGVTVAAAFGCPFEGEVPIDRLLRVVDAVAAGNPREIAIADTIGVATPRDVAERVGAVIKRFPDIPIRCHFHNTRNTGFANAWAAIEAGATTLDSSFAGVGGCPFAPRATGNIATEDLVYMLDRAGITTGVDLDLSIAAAQWLEEKLGKTLPGQVMKAGGFPKAA
ncbi:MAG: hydroxymethylglutaryl-CoA lyase [Roseitalea sp.]|jgi:hydroxymethylglutaryl-CoA lyase|nr:hydroxymethylglutaryl-CoA lyase [Roseitalea sp.]MBO6741456.1 hydroxymethylglutaryl-CoA lyase [Roseitalea sp.]